MQLLRFFINGTSRVGYIYGSLKLGVKHAKHK
jgi:hypothetical protein